MMMCPATLLHRRPTATTTPPLYSNLCNKREMAPNVCPARVPLSLHMLEHVRGACESYLYSVQFFFFLSLSLSHCVCLFLYFALFVVAAKAYLSSQSRYYSRNELCVCVAFVRLRYNKCMFYIIFFFVSSLLWFRTSLCCCVGALITCIQSNPTHTQLSIQFGSSSLYFISIFGDLRKIFTCGFIIQ